MKFYNSHAYVSNIFENIKPIYAYDNVQNHQKWREKAKEKLTELLGLPFQKCEDKLRILCETKQENYKQISFEFQSEEGYYIPGELLIPNDMVAPRPTVICLQGHTSGKHLSVGIKKFKQDEEIFSMDFALQAIGEGYCAVVFEQRYMGECGQNALGTPNCLAENRSMATVLLGRTAIGERVWDVSRVIDILEHYFQEYVDLERIVCLGHSGGGTVAFYAACIDERIYITIPSCSVCTFKESVVPEYHCGCNYIPGIAKYFDMGDIGCLLAPRRLIQLNGVRDPLFYIQGARKCHQVIQKAYEYLECTENCHMIEGEGEHEFFPELVWPIIKREIE